MPKFRVTVTATEYGVFTYEGDVDYLQDHLDEIIDNAEANGEIFWNDRELSDGDFSEDD